MLAALDVLGCDGFLVGVERPLNTVLDKAVTENGAAMIEHDRVSLATGRPQHASDHLPE